jgi:hypothetical protein
MKSLSTRKEYLAATEAHGGDEPRSRGRPSTHFPLSKRAIEQRRERLRRYSGLVAELQSPTKFAHFPSLPTKAISVTLSLPSLLLLDLYVEYASERSSIVPTRFHHGSIIDTLSHTLLSDSQFKAWLEAWELKKSSRLSDDPTPTITMGVY